MVIDWVLVVSILVVLVMIWGVGYCAVFMFMHIDKDSQAVRKSKDHKPE